MLMALDDGMRTPSFTHGAFDIQVISEDYGSGRHCLSLRRRPMSQTIWSIE